MGNYDNDSLKRLNQLFSKDPSVYSIFEEEIDIEVQRKFYEYLETLSSKALLENNKSLEEKEMLYDDNTPLTKKKEILSLLANLNKVEAYREIEKFKKEGDKDLKKWACIALQQSRMMLESSLLDEKSIFISTGLGGKGNKLRYFCVLFTLKTKLPSEKELSILNKEINFAFKKVNAELESFEFTSGIITFKSLIPINVNIKILFDDIISEINNYGHLLKKNMIITNVKSLSIEEIDKLLNKESEE